MIIQKMTQKNAKSYEITLDDQRTFIVSEDVLVKFRLLKGKEVDESLLAEIKKASAYDIGLQQALNYLSYQLRTEKEIAAYLKEKEIGAEDIQKICQYLKNQRLIDDVQYAKSYLQTALRLNDKGPAVIANKLKEEYQRPCCIVALNGDNYEGSMRGYERSGITNFKDICEKTHCVNWV